MNKSIYRLIISVAALALTFSLFASPRPVQAKGKDLPTIVGIALSVNAQTGEFSTLIAALQYTELVDALNGKRKLTVFAPTDAAFAKLGLNAGNINTLPKEAVANILLYHVTPGERTAEKVIKKDKLKMLNKGVALIEVNDNGAFIDGAKIIQTDIMARNGVIHIIDTVMSP